MRIAEGSLDIGMAEQPGDNAQTHAAVDRDRRERMPEIVNARRRKSRRRAEHVPFLVYRRRPLQGDAHTHGQLVR